MWRCAELLMDSRTLASTSSSPLRALLAVSFAVRDLSHTFRRLSESSFRLVPAMNPGLRRTSCVPVKGSGAAFGETRSAVGLAWAAGVSFDRASQDSASLADGGESVECGGGACPL